MIFKDQKNKIITLIIILSIFLLYFILILTNNHTALAYITNQGEDTVSVIDLSNKRELKKINVGESPLGVHILSRNKLAVIGNVKSRTLSVIDINSNILLKTIPLNFTPLGITSDTSEDRLFITDWFNNKVAVLSVKN